MTLPTVYPTGFQGDETDFLKAKVDRSGAMRQYKETQSIADTTSSGVIIGLMPFTAGCRISAASNILFGDFDTATNVTANVGYIYADNDTVTYVNDIDAFVAAATGPQTGGNSSFVASAGRDFVALADGWVALQFTADTTSAASIKYDILFAYDN